MTTIAPPRAATTASTAAAEWLKLRSLRSTWWFLGGSALILLLLAAIEADDGDPATTQGLGLAMNGIGYFVQYILAGLAVLAITSEFATRSILVTLACTPARTRVMVAKTVVTAGLVGISGLLFSGLCVAVAAIRFDELAVLTPRVLVDLLAIGGYLATIAVLSLGVGALVRRTAGALAVIVALLLLVPEVLGLIARRFDAAVLATIADLTPAPAGYRFMAGEGTAGIVLAGWALAGLLLGCWALRSRDA
jgi:ABC-2 type transport system permease protein